MGFKIKISKQLAVKLAFFMLLIGSAIVIDNYLNKNPKPVSETKSESEPSKEAHNVVYVIYPTSNYSVKPLVLKTFQRKIFEVSQSKFLQKYHQFRNFYVLKNESDRLNSNQITVCNNFVFRHIYFSFHDDKPHIS